VILQVERDGYCANVPDRVNSLNLVPEEDRALVLQDSCEWRKHWDHYARSEPGGFHSITSFLGQMTLGTTQQPKDDELVCLQSIRQKGWNLMLFF
jgi:hypothetical protein